MLPRRGVARQRGGSRGRCEPRPQANSWRAAAPGGGGEDRPPRAVTYSSSTASSSSSVGKPANNPCRQKHVFFKKLFGRTSVKLVRVRLDLSPPTISDCLVQGGTGVALRLPKVGFQRLFPSTF